MFWEIRGKRAGKQGRWLVESVSEVGAQTKAKWSGIEVAVALPVDAPPPKSSRAKSKGVVRVTVPATP